MEYPHKALIEGNDPRGIDVAVLSLHPIDSMSTHQEDTEIVYYPKEPKVEKVFRRDCLEVRILKEGKDSSHLRLPLQIHDTFQGGNEADQRGRGEGS